MQEEVGLNGAAMIAHSIKPNMAIITDVCHDTTTPMINKKSEGEIHMGKGPVLSVAPSVHNKLLDFVLQIAIKKNIPYQMEALSRSTGTDTDAFFKASGGIPSLLISLPQRYMHTTVESVHRDDVENVIRLFYETIIAITPNFNFKYL